MRTKKIIIALIGGLSLNMACNESNVHTLSEEELRGGLSLKLETNADITPKISSDRSTKGVSRDENGDIVITTPDLDDFQITLSDANGETVNSWDTYDDMPTVVRLTEGDYQITATYGETHTGGVFAEPRLEGSTDFTLERQKTNSVSVVCKVADVLVTVDYTEGFANYFKHHALTVYSDNVAFDIVKGEKRVACFNPGNLSTLLTVTQQNDQQLTLSPVVLTDAKSGEYYRLRFDVGTDGAGGTHLLLTFDDTTEEEPIRIELSEESMSNPFYTLDGFESGDVIELVQGVLYPDNLSALVTARSFIASCVAKTTSSELLAKGWPADGFELVGISEANKTLLKGFGFEWTEGLAGLNMAILNFQGLAENMPAGLTDALSHEIEVITTDMAGQESEPLLLTFHIVPPEFEITGYDTQPYAMKTNTTTYYVEVTKGDRNKIFFEYFNPTWNQWHKVSSTIGDEALQGWSFAVKDIDWSWTSVRLRAGYEGREGSYSEKEIFGRLESPTGTIMTRWSYSAIFRTINMSADDKYYDPSHYSIKLSTDKGNTWDVVKTYTVYRDYSDGVRYVYIAMNDLIPGVEYTARVTYDPNIGLIPTTGDYAITTEPILNLPNSGFEDWDTAAIYADIPQGGSTSQYLNVTHLAMTTTIIDAYPLGWTTINMKTIPANQINKNTWYMQPAVMESAVTHGGSGAALIRNVGWNDKGGYVIENTLTIEKTDETGTYYTGNDPRVPGNFKYSVGKLFLSEDGYSYDHDTNTETYNSRTSFISRPAKLKGYYQYVPVGDDKGQVLVQLLSVDPSGTESVLGEGSLVLTATDSYTLFEVPITYSSGTSTASHIRVMFAASDKASDSQDIENAAGIETITYLGPKSTINTQNPIPYLRFDFFKIGSQLWIDDVELEYQ